MRSLSPRYRTVSLDLPGHGNSADVAGPYSIERFAAEVFELARELSLRETTLVSHSMGNYVAIELVAKRRFPAAGLVLIDGATYAAGEREVVEGQAKARLAASGYAAFTEQAFRQMFFSSAHEEARLRVLARAMKFSDAVGQQMFPNVLGWAAEHLPNALREIQAPVLVIQATAVDDSGTRSQIASPDDSAWVRMCKRYLRSCEVQILADCGHFAMLEQPEEAFGTIRSFLAAHAS